MSDPHATPDRAADPRPSQAEVEAKAAEMFGKRWKEFPESLKRQGDRIIATRLDQARAAVLEQRQ